MNNNQEKIEAGVPNIYVHKPETEEASSVEGEIAKLEAMHILGQINLGDENDSFSKIYVELLEEYEKKYKELPKEPFVRNESEAKNILSPKEKPAEIKIESVNNPSLEVQKIKEGETKISPLSLFEEPLNI